jgi:hypothetical protein
MYMYTFSFIYHKHFYTWLNCEDGYKYRFNYDANIWQLPIKLGWGILNSSWSLITMSSTRYHLVCTLSENYTSGLYLLLTVLQNNSFDNFLINKYKFDADNSKHRPICRLYDMQVMLRNCFNLEPMCPHSSQPLTTRKGIDACWGLLRLET